MKKYKNIKKIGKYTFVSGEEVFRKASKSKEFIEAYNEEYARLQLVSQIKRIRFAQKLTQKEIAKKAEMPQSVIARIESGTHSFSLGTLQRIAQVFKKEIQLV